MKTYFERLLETGVLAVMGAFITSPLLVTCIFYGWLAFWTWLGIWVVALILCGFIDPNTLGSNDDDTSAMEYEYR